MPQRHQGRTDLFCRQPIEHKGIVRVRTVGGDNFSWGCGHGGAENSNQYHTVCGPEQTARTKSGEMEKGRSHRGSLGTRRASLPVINAAQERATRGKLAQPRILRPFVTLLCCPSSGIRCDRPHPCPVLSVSPPAAVLRGAFGLEPFLPSWFLIEILLPVAPVVNSANSLR